MKTYRRLRLFKQANEIRLGKFLFVVS